MPAEPRLLVLGAEGQLGRVLAMLGRPGIVALGRPACDITDPAMLGEALAATRPDVVVNAAAYTDVERAEVEPAACMRINAEAPGHIARACARVGAALIHVSTDYVFDGRATTPCDEDAPVNPLNVYGASKAAGEAAVRAALERHVILRTAWLFAPWGRNFPATVLRLAAAGRPLRIVADQVGCPTPVAPLAAAIAAVARRIGAGAAHWGTFHFAGQPPASWHGFANAIVEAALPPGRRPPVLPITSAEYPARATRPRQAVLDCRRIAAAYGIAAPDWRTNLAASLPPSSSSASTIAA